MSSEQPRRPRDGGSAGSPMGSTAAIIIAIVAVVAGFLILRQIRDDDGGTASSGTGGATETTLAPGTETTLDPSQTVAPTIALPTTSTTPPIVTEGATAVVANASRVNGAAGVLTTALTGQKFLMSKGINATVKQEVSTVLYNPANPAALSVATSIATLMGGIVVSTLPEPPLVEGGALPTGVDVLVMLGSDKASLTLEQMGAPATTTIPGAATTLPGVETTTTVPA
jgi:hypothetical protein